MKYTVHASGVEPNSPEVGINSRYEASVGGGTLPRLPPVTKASRTGQRLALPLCLSGTGRCRLHRRSAEESLTHSHHADNSRLRHVPLRQPAARTGLNLAQASPKFRSSRWTARSRLKVVRSALLRTWSCPRFLPGEGQLSATRLALPPARQAHQNPI
jgi:hypothetical protein